MSDGKYFASTKKGKKAIPRASLLNRAISKPFLDEESCSPAGEILEFKSELHGSDKSKRKDAVKKVIAAMTVGKDVSMLFPDVVNCMQVFTLDPHTDLTLSYL